MDASGNHTGQRLTDNTDRSSVRAVPHGGDVTWSPLPAPTIEDAAASQATDPVRDDVAHERGDPGQDEDEDEAQAAGPRHRAGREQDRHRGDWQPDLLREHPAEDDQIAVADENVDEVVILSTQASWNKVQDFHAKNAQNKKLARSTSHSLARLTIGGSSPTNASMPMWPRWLCT